METKQLPSQALQSRSMPEIAHSVNDLLGIAADALRIRPPLYLS